MLGLVATVALLIYAALLFALIKLIPITLTLPGIAGMVLTLAVAADANIVMYERIKEEVRSGRSVPAAISAGYTKALRTIIDANVVTIGVAFILFTLATAGVRGFAFTLGVGTLVSLFTAVLATSAILGTLARTRLLRRPSALGVGTTEDREGWRFDFMGNVALVLLVLRRDPRRRGDRDRLARAQLRHRLRVGHADDGAAPAGARAWTRCARRSSRSATATPRSRRSRTRSSASTCSRSRCASSPRRRSRAVENALDDDYQVAAGDFVSNSVGPTFGEQIARTALLAVIASLLLIALYIGFRFEWKFAVPVMIALAHDLLITAGVYALFDREVTSATVAALLTIMGYSLYDTVIVFDRIRENVPRMPRATFSQIANRSMSEVFTRSLATSFVVLMPVGSLLLFGGDTLKDFAFALLVGVISGAYSSIFIATPVLVEWKEREQTYMRRRRMMLQQYGGRIPAFAPGTLGEPEPAPAAAAAAPAAAATAAPETPTPTSRAARRQRRAAGPTASTTRTAPRPQTRPPAAGDGDGAPPSPPPEPRRPRSPRPPRRRRPRSRSRSRSASRSAGSTGGASDGDGRLGDDGNRDLALHGVPAGPLLGRHRRRLPGRVR